MLTKHQKNARRLFKRLEAGKCPIKLKQSSYGNCGKNGDFGTGCAITAIVGLDSTKALRKCVDNNFENHPYDNDKLHAHVKRLFGRKGGIGIVDAFDSSYYAEKPDNASWYSEYNRIKNPKTKLRRILKNIWKYGQVHRKKAGE